MNVINVFLQENSIVGERNWITQDTTPKAIVAHPQIFNAEV
jgi:hypothetical protein